VRARRCEEELLVSRKEPAAGGLSPSIGDTTHGASIDSHHVLLVASASFTRALKSQPLPIVTEIRFGILSAERDLTYRTEVPLTGDGRYRSRCCR
jgi:hypothetical protein